MERTLLLPAAKIFFCVPSANVTFTKALPSNCVVNCSSGTFVSTPESVHALPPLPNFALGISIVNEPDIADETEAGEHYLDSLSVAPQYQRLGIGRNLIDAFCQRAFSEGAERVGLIVDAENSNAERLYLSQGFTHVGERIFFNHQMHHLQRTKSR